MATKTDAAMVPMDVEYAPAWLTWIAATTTCLRALGVQCDQTDVAGMSSYAFHLCVHPELCPSGPTVLDWNALHAGINFLGRSTLAYAGGDSHFSSHPEHSSGLSREHCRRALELARAEVEAGRPCVVWGTYVPEFAAVVGVQGDAFVVRSFKEVIGQDQPPIPFDKLDAPGSVYLLAFPDACGALPHGAEHMAVRRAIHRLTTPSSFYRYGAAAYDMWIEALQAKRANGFGNSYNAACYAEGRRFARDFLARAAKRSEFAGETLNQASEAYAKAAEGMNRLTKLFPFPGAEREPVSDDNAIAEAVDALREAKGGECRAIDLLSEVVAMAPPKS